jgi:hypothetical protein
MMMTSTRACALDVYTLRGRRRRRREEGGGAGRLNVKTKVQYYKWEWVPPSER